MKLTLAIFAALLIHAIAHSEATPTTEKSSSTAKPAVTASKDLKEAIKNARKNKKECAMACTANYDPVCVHDPSDATFKARTFGNPCALDAQNCESGTKWVVKSKGECPGSDGVRLSV